MDKILEVRGMINDCFQGNKVAQNHFFKTENKDAYAAFCNSKFLIQDTGEAVFVHMKRGFSKDPMQAYIEFWGVMQAIIIQQDSICELYDSVTEKKLNTTGLTAWKSLRTTRNLCVGHPSNQSNRNALPRRTFIGRMGMTYKNIQFEMWDADTKQTSFPEINLEEMIREYDVEAALILEEILDSMKSQWL